MSDKRPELEDILRESEERKKNFKMEIDYDAVSDIPEASEEEPKKDGSTSDESAPAPNPKKRGKKRREKAPFSLGKLIGGLVLTAVILSVSIFCASYIITVGKDVLGVEKSDEKILITIPSGATAEDIANILYDKGVISQVTAFRAVSKFSKADSYKAGDHVVQPSMPYETIIEELQSDPIQNKVSVNVTFPEGYTLVECAAAMEKANVCSAEDFIKAFNDSSFGYAFEEQISDSYSKFYKMEGYCFPDTYTFFEESEPEIAAKKIIARYNEKVNAQMLGRMKDLGLSLDEMMAFASIVQAEAGNKDQMRMVASVFWNRLNNSDEFPKLQSDTTRGYVRDVIDKYIVVPNEKLNKAYDTYECDGFPPGAICNPGVDAIEAVLYPEDSDFYYFCSNLDTGEFFYAKTLSEHEANLVKAGLT